MDKNKDAVPDEHLALLQGAGFDFLVKMIKDNNSNSNCNNSTGSESPVNLITNYHRTSIRLISLVSFFFLDQQPEASQSGQKTHSWLYIQGTFPYLQLKYLLTYCTMYFNSSH